ncbi:MAG: hypothetical protein EP323_00385 [Gammaproteobacteria bacterium]|nr:MAG: hypothetical protein EP323_00385 [Gammaproteobacteria bacterium]
MSEIHTWDVAAANNNSASPNGWPENMAYSAVNNSARENMAAAARLYADTNGTLTSGGSANAYTLTPNRTISAYASGLTFKFKANHTSTGAATINVSALGAKDLKSPDGSALAAGYIKQDQWYTVFYQGAYFIVSSDLVAIQAGNTQVKYAFSSTTTMADPTSGFLRLNNATVSSVTAIAFSDNSGNSGAPDVSAFINSFDDSSSTLKGILSISEIGSPEKMAIFSVSGLTDNAGWSEVAVSHIASAGSFTDNKSLSVHFTRTGDGASAAQILSLLLTVDGAGSGLDADKLDGQEGSYYLAASSYTAADVLSKLITVDGTGTGLDADLLDGVEGANYLRTDNTGAKSVDGAPYCTEYTLTDGATVTWTPTNGVEAVVTLGGNRTLDLSAVPAAGTWLNIRVVQDGTGSRTLAYSADFDFGDSGSPTLTTTAGAEDVLSFRSNGTVAQFMGIAKGFA